SEGGGIDRYLFIGCVRRPGQRGARMKRREFITLLGCWAATWPIAARAQQSDRMRRIAMLMLNAEDDPEGQARVAAFRQGLQALGWTEGKNLRIDWNWTAGDVERIRSDVRELAAHPPDIIVANGRPILSEAVQVIHSIPIVFVLVNDPVGEGFIFQSGASWRQRYRLYLLRVHHVWKVAGAAQKGCACGQARQLHLQSGYVCLLRSICARFRDRRAAVFNQADTRPRGPTSPHRSPCCQPPPAPCCP